MARRLAIAVALALLTVAFVVLKDASRSDARFTVVSGPGNPVLPIVLHRDLTRFDVHATRVRGPGNLFLEVATYLQPPHDTLALTVLGDRGVRVARCVFPPGSYTDNGRLTCPLRDISSARAVLVTRQGRAKVAVYGHKRKAGFLVRNEAASLAGRISTVLSRIAVPLPNGLGSGLLLLSLFGSVTLTGFALLLAAPVERRLRRSPADPETVDRAGDPER